MAFFEERFPDDIAQGATGGPRFKTSVTKTRSGQRGANRDWLAPLHFYNVAQAIKTRADFEAVRSFFWVVYGAFDGFRFKDFADYSCTAARGVCTLVSGSAYQLGKTYSYGSRSVTRNITKPVAGTVAILRTRSGSTTDITGASALDTTTGIVTVTGHASGDVYTWSGEFDVPAVFADDAMDVRQLNSDSNLVLDWGAIAIEEVRL